MRGQQKYGNSRPQGFVDVVYLYVNSFEGNWKTGGFKTEARKELMMGKIWDIVCRYNFRKWKVRLQSQKRARQVEAPERIQDSKPCMYCVLYLP